MQPSPRAETSRLLFPSLRFCIASYLTVPTGAGSSRASAVDSSRWASICIWRSATCCSASAMASAPAMKRRGGGHGRRLQELGAEEPRVDDRGGDAERRNLLLQRLHPALEAELRRGICRTEGKPDEAGGRRDRDNVPGAPLAHDRQDGAGDIHRPDEERPQLPVYLLRRQLLEVAGKEVAGIVDQHVDAAEPVDGGPRRRRGVGAVCDVQLEDQQVTRLSHGLGYGVGVPAGGHDGVTCGQGGLDEIDAHATAGTSNKPNLLVSLASHGTSWIRVPAVLRGQS